MVKKPTAILPNCTGLILVIDGDNTLWDTNRVFEDAQHWLVESLRKTKSGVWSMLSFEQLRQVDDLLIVHLGRQEYDFQLLVLVLIYTQKGLTEKEAISTALSTLQEYPDSADAKLATKIGQAFRRRLQRIPPLLPSVSCSLEELLRLKTLYKGKLALILLSEGDKTRIGPILKRYLDKSRVFDAHYLVERKSKDALLKAQVQGSKVLKRQSGCSHSQLVVIGDSIKGDIVPGNSVGAITVYIAGSYRGSEKPTNNRERPQIALTSFSQLPKLVESILTASSSTK